MQTFIPFPNFFKSAQVLDYRRLGKQRLEAKQIYLALNDKNYGWQNHPAVKMWRGHEQSLLDYGMAICTEWIGRGYVDNQFYFFFNAYGEKFGNPNQRGNLPMPEWITDKFCLSHKSNLVRKKPDYYRPFFPDIPDNLPYIWPV